MEEAVKIAAQYGVAGIALLALGLLTFKIGDRMIKSIDRMIERADENSKATVNALSSMSKEVQLAISQANARQLEELGDLSERISRVETVLNLKDLPKMAAGGKS